MSFTGLFSSGVRVVVAGGLALATLPSAGQATTIDFNELKNSGGGTYYVYGPYVDPTGDYQLSASTCPSTRNGPNCFVTTPTAGIGSLDRVGAALTNYAGSSTITLGRVDGAAFFVESIDFAPLYGNSSGFGPTTLDLAFTFTFADGRSPLSRTTTIANTAGQALTVTTLDFSDLGGLTGLSFRPMAGSSGFVQFDNIMLSTGAVPEPATWAMMIAGFGIAGGAMRRRKAATLATA